MGRFYRVAAGDHVGPGPEGCECDRCVHDRMERGKAKDDPNYVPRLLSHIYKMNDVIETDEDLTVFNQPGSMKFELVDAMGRPTLQETRTAPPQPQAQQPVSDGLELMNVKDLRKHAAEEEIDLGDAKGKTEIIKKIREAMVAAAAELGFNS